MAKKPTGKNSLFRKELAQIKIRKTIGSRLTNERNLNISRIAEQALNSILDYVEVQNTQTSSAFFGKASFQKERFVVPRASFTPSFTPSFHD